MPMYLVYYNVKQSQLIVQLIQCYYVQYHISINIESCDQFIYEFCYFHSLIISINCG